MQFQLELTVFYVCFLLQKAVITNVSPDILYLFRVQAVCQHDLRSDFSQTLLFRGMWSQQVYSKAFVPSSNALIDGYINILCPSLFCFTANTTRIFEGSRIVKTGMVSWPEDGSAHFFLHLSDVHVIFCWVTISPPPLSAHLPQPTVSPASSADMAPISSGSSTWTSSGIHFSIVSMATGMGPSSSGSQATVASVVTSTLLAGLGVGGGVISSMPSSVWPTQAPQATQNPTRPSTAPAKSNNEQTPPQGSETDNASEENNAPHEGEEEGEEGEKDGEKEEEEEQQKKKKEKTGTDNGEKQANSTLAKKPLIPTPASTAKEKGEGKPTVKGTTVPPSTGEDVESNPTGVNPVSTQEPRNSSVKTQIPKNLPTKIPTENENANSWPFSVHTGEQDISIPVLLFFISFFPPPHTEKSFELLLSLFSLVVGCCARQDFFPKHSSVNTTSTYRDQFSRTNNLI